MSLVPVLDGSMNWQAWRPMMMNYLLSQGQWKVITNKFPAPDYETTTTVTKMDSEGTHTETVPDISKPTRNQSDIDSWFDTNDRALGNIMLHLHPTIATTVLNLLQKTIEENDDITTMFASVAWEYLDATYGKPVSRTQIRTQDITQLCHEIRDIKKGRINNELPDDLSKTSSNIPAQQDTRDRGAPGYAGNVYSTLYHAPPSDNHDSPARRDSSPPLDPLSPVQTPPGPPPVRTPSPTSGTSVGIPYVTVAPGSGELPVDVENKERNSPSDSCLCPASSWE